jgi:plasmid maintenance system antidote protein VapI
MDTLNKLKSTMADAGVTQKQLAKELNIHHVYLNAAIQGRRRLSPQLANLIVEKFPNLTLKYILHL